MEVATSANLALDRRRRFAVPSTTGGPGVLVDLHVSHHDGTHPHLRRVVVSLNHLRGPYAETLALVLARRNETTGTARQHPPVASGGSPTTAG
jgi:hypothetical protein